MQAPLARETLDATAMRASSSIVVLALALGAPAHAAPPGATPPQPTLEQLQDLPEHLSAEEDDDPPPGYVALQKRRKGLIISGSITLGIGLFFGVAAATDRNHPSDAMWVPIVGPIYNLAHEPNDLTSNKPFILLTLGAQVTGAVLFSLGIFTKHREFWRIDQVSDLRVVPTGDGFAVAGSF